MRVLGKIKKICLVFMVAAMVLTLSGCGSSSSKSEQESSTKTDDKTVYAAPDQQQIHDHTDIKGPFSVYVLHDTAGKLVGRSGTVHKAAEQRSQREHKQKALDRARKPRDVIIRQRRGHGNPAAQRNRAGAYNRGDSGVKSFIDKYPHHGNAENDADHA